MKTALIVLTLLLTGCGGATIPTRVEIPIPVPCKTPEPAEPAYRFAPPYADVFEGTRDLLGDRELSLAYENELRTALKSCK